jgi:hypothetical protein
MPYYAETPFERIVDVHWKHEDTGGGPPLPGSGGCGSGWWPMTGWFGGGDGFPSQTTTGPAILTAGGGVIWNGAFIAPGEHTPGYYDLFVIPGMGAHSETISVVWGGTIPTPPFLLVGVWYFGARQPYPPYLDSPGGSPPPNPPPDNPDDSVSISSAAGTFTLDPARAIGTVVIGFASGGGLARQTTAPLMPSSPDVPSLQEIHYGYPGSPPSEGIWIEVGHDCP